MTDKKSTPSKQRPEHTVSCHEVTAQIYLRQSPSGYQYHQIELSRTWRSVSTGKQCQGATFFHKNEEDLIEAIRKASAWIRDRLTPDRVGNPTPRNDEAAA